MRAYSTGNEFDESLSGPSTRNVSGDLRVVSDESRGHLRADRVAADEAEQLTRGVTARLLDERKNEPMMHLRPYNPTEQSLRNQWSDTCAFIAGVSAVQPKGRTIN